MSPGFCVVVAADLGEEGEGEEGATAKKMGEGGRLHSKGIRGGGLVGRIEIHGPTRSHVSSRPQRMRLNLILLFYW